MKLLLVLLFVLVAPFAHAADDPAKAAMRGFVEKKLQDIANTPRLSIGVTQDGPNLEGGDVKMLINFSSTLTAPVNNLELTLTLPAGFTLKESQLPTKILSPDKMAVRVSIPAQTKQNYVLVMKAPLLPSQKEVKYWLGVHPTGPADVIKNTPPFMINGGFWLEPAPAGLSLKQDMQSKPFSMGEPAEYTLTASNKGPGAAHNVTINTWIGMPYELLGVQGGTAQMQPDKKHILINIGDLPANTSKQAKVMFKPMTAGGTAITSDVSSKDLQSDMPYGQNNLITRITIQGRTVMASGATGGDIYLILNQKRWAECRAKFSDSNAQKECVKNLTREQLGACQNADKAQQAACLTQKYGR